MSVRTFWARIKKMNRNLPYLPGTGNALAAEQLRAILIHAVPIGVENLLALTQVDWEDVNAVSDIQLIEHMDRVLPLVEEVKKNPPKPRPNRRTQNPKHKNKKSICEYCTKAK